jgi:3-methyl-2-oxobutanoate hydroxymethyltransferase
VAKILDDLCDILLVGDSLGMTIYGLQDTVDVSLEMMINHGKAVMRANRKALVVVDIPAGSFEKSPKQALETAEEIIAKTGCDALKIETSYESLAAIEILTKNNIAVMSHVGLLPQQVRKIGGYKYQGKSEEQAQDILEIAKLSEKAGAFACVIEAVPASLADKITAALKIPTIGIGASANCDGQVLVIDDLLGLNQEFKPKFVRNYANLASDVNRAVTEFVADVKSKKFPAKENLV